MEMGKPNYFIRICRVVSAVCKCNTRVLLSRFSLLFNITGDVPTDRVNKFYWNKRIELLIATLTLIKLKYGKLLSRISSLIITKPFSKAVVKPKSFFLLISELLYAKYY